MRWGGEVERGGARALEADDNPMNRLFRIWIDQEVLVSDLERETREQVTLGRVHDDLRSAGFVADGSAWVVREVDLGYLLPSEVTLTEVIEDFDPDF